jgi:hypothetical protein
MSRLPVCPECGQTDLVEKASTLYLAGTEMKYRRSKKNPGEVQPPEPSGENAPIQLSPGFRDLSAAELQALARRLAPPATKKEAPVRPINPDWAVAAVSMIVPLFLYQIITTQVGMLPVVLLALAAFYGFYFWQRKNILARFDARQEKERSKVEQVKQSIQRWMSLYYCGRDDCVFDPSRKVSAPADQLNGILMG